MQRTDKEVSEDVKRKTFQTSENATQKRDKKDKNERRVSKRKTKTRVTDTVNESGSDAEKKKRNDRRRKTELT